MFAKREHVRVSEIDHVLQTYEDPSPALVASQAVHLSNACSKKSRERARQRGGAVEHSHAALRLVRRIPLRHDPDGTWEEPGPSLLGY